MAKVKEPNVMVKIKKVCIDSGDLGIETKYGKRFFFHSKVYEMPREEALELIKVRTAQRKKYRKPECDLIIVDE